MTPIQSTSVRRTLAALSVPALLALSLTACGGSNDGGGDASGSSTSASQEDFCAAVNKQPDNFDSDNIDDSVNAAHDYAKTLKDVGTPSDMTADERTGFEAFTNYLGAVTTDDAKSLSDSSGAGDIFGDNAEQVGAYLGYAAKECGGSGLPGTSDLPSSSDLPTLPDTSDLPTLPTTP